MDFILLKRHLDVNGTVLTLLGMNVRHDLTHLDYVRWFITYILLWYVLFYFARRYLNPSRTIIALLCASVVLLPANYYLFGFGWYKTEKRYLRIIEGSQ